MLAAYQECAARFELQLYHLEIGAPIKPTGHVAQAVRGRVVFNPLADRQLVYQVFKYLSCWPRTLRGVIKNICPCHSYVFHDIYYHDMLHMYCPVHNSIYTISDRLAVNMPFCAEQGAPLAGQPCIKQIYTSCDIDGSDTIIEIHNTYGFVSQNFEDQLNHIINVYHIDHDFTWLTFHTDWSETSQIITNNSLTYYRSNYKVTILDLNKRCVVWQFCDLHCGRYPARYPARYPSCAMNWGMLYNMCFSPNGTLYVLSINEIYKIEY